MTDYLLILLADLLFASQFLMTKLYSARNPQSALTSFAFSFGSELVILLYMVAFSSFTIIFTPFSLAMAAITAVIMIAASYCSIAALKYINLSLYSVFLMLGGMLLPSIFGIIWADEPLTLGKVLCLLLIGGSMVLGVEKTATNKKGAVKYYILCFLLNGLNGIVAKIHTMYPALNTSSNNFIILTSLCVCALTGVILLANGKQVLPRFKDVKNLGCMAGYAVVHGVAQFLSLLTLERLPVSLQQPMVTGGVLGFSFLISVIMKEKQTKKSVISFVLAVLAIIAVTCL